MAMIDPNIALSYRPNNLGIQTPVEVAGQQQQLANLQTSNQLGQQQIEAAKLENQQRQLALQDQGVIRQAFIDSKGSNGNDFLNLARQRGANPKALLALQASLLDMKTKAATYTKDQLANQQATNDQLQSLLSPVANETDPAKQQAAWNTGLQQALAKGLMTPEEAAQHPYPGADGVKSYVSSLNLQKWALSEQQLATGNQRNAQAKATEQQQAQRDFQQASARLGATKTTDEYQQVLSTLPYGIAKQFEGKTADDARRIGLTSQQQTQADQAAANAAQTAGNQAANLALRGREVDINQQRLGIAQKEYQQKYGGVDVLGQLSPANRAISEKLASGDFNPAQLGRMPNKEMIIAGAIQSNPAWTPQLYATKKDFTDPKGTQAKNLGTISRIVGHIGRFESNSKQMGFAPAYAMGANLTGSQNALNNDAHAIAGELEKLVSGGVGSVEQTREWEKALHSPSADARQTAIDEISQLIGSQYEGMQQTYKAGTGQDLPIDKYISPAGLKWMNAKGIDVIGASPAPAAPAPSPAPAATAPSGVRAPAGSVSVTDPRGGVHWFRNQAAADNFKRVAGIR